MEGGHLRQPCLERSNSFIFTIFFVFCFAPVFPNKGTSRNFNPDCAKAGKYCIAEVEEIVEMGEIKPEDVHLPGVFVKVLVRGLCFPLHRLERIIELLFLK